MKTEAQIRQQIAQVRQQIAEGKAWLEQCQKEYPTLAALHRQQYPERAENLTPKRRPQGRSTASTRGRNTGSHPRGGGG